MADLSEFHERQQKPPGFPCTVTAALHTLDGGRADQLRAALADPNIWHTTISEVVADWGVRLAPNTVSRHRRGKCRCDD